MALKVFLVVMPAAYFIAVGLYTYFAPSVSKRLKETSEKKKKGGTSSHVREFQARRRQEEEQRKAEGPPGATEAFVDLEKEELGQPDLSDSYVKRPKKPMELQFYHFLPIVRFYLVIKEKEATDIEGVFRVNSLSSFTLGFAQIAGMIFMLGVYDQEMTL